MISSFCLVFRSPPFPKLDFGLCARVFSAVFTHLEPTILFSHSPAVSLSKPRDFRLYEPTILFYPLVSGFLHRKFLWSRDRSRPIRSLHLGQTGPLYYCGLYICLIFIFLHNVKTKTDSMISFFY